MRQSLKGRLAAYLLFFLLAAFLAGCSMSKAPEVPLWPSDVPVLLIGGGQTEAYELTKDVMIYGTAGSTYVESTDGDINEHYDKILSVLGVAIGDDMEKLFGSGSMKVGSAMISCDHPDAESGERVTTKMVYDGSRIDLEELNAYDCMVVISFYYESGKWHMLDFSCDSPEKHEHVIAITYDIQGPQGEYGARTGQVCGIFCEFY